MKYRTVVAATLVFVLLMSASWVSDAAPGGRRARVMRTVQRAALPVIAAAALMVSGCESLPRVKAQFEKATTREMTLAWDYAPPHWPAWTKGKVRGFVVHHGPDSHAAQKAPPKAPAKPGELTTHYEHTTFVSGDARMATVRVPRPNTVLQDMQLPQNYYFRADARAMGDKGLQTSPYTHELVIDLTKE